MTPRDWPRIKTTLLYTIILFWKSALAINQIHRNHLEKFFKKTHRTHHSAKNKYDSFWALEASGFLCQDKWLLDLTNKRQGEA